MSGHQLTFPASGDPIACFTFDDVSGTTIYDSVGSYDLTITNVVRTSVTSGGRIGDCLVHSGSAGVSITTPSSNIAFTSISLWAKFPVLGTNIYELFNTGSGTCFTRGSDNQLKLFGTNVGYEVTSATNWHHIVVVKDSAATAKVYVNTSYIGQVSTSGYDIDEIESFGTLVNSTGYYGASLDVITVYDYELSASDIETIFYLDGIRATIPILEFAGEGEVTASGSLSADIPFFDLDFTAVVNISCDLGASLPLLTADWVTGLNASCGFSLPVISFSGHFGSDAAITLPLLEVEASCSTNAIASCSATLPMFDMLFEGTAEVISDLSFSLFVPNISSSGMFQESVSAGFTLPMLDISFDGMSKDEGDDALTFLLPMLVSRIEGSTTNGFTYLQYVRGALR